MLVHHVVNIITGTAMISIFLGIFFFTYASRIEQKIVIDRSTEIVQELTSDITNFALPQQINIIKSQIVPNLVIPKSLSLEDQAVQAQNKALVRKTVIYISVFVAICVLIVGGLSFAFHVPLIELIKNNLFILFFVALTEYSFLTFYAKNYVTVDANFVKCKIIDAIIRFGKANTL